MSIELITVLMFAAMILFLLTGRQIFVIVGAVGTISALALWGTGGHIMPFMGVFSFMKWYPLMAIPPFVFMGMILAKSGVADDLFKAIYHWMGSIRGGLGMGTIGFCSLISAMTGTLMCATVTSATIALPAMRKRKYDKLLLTGIVQAGGALGFLIPPSIIFILYGIIAKVSIGHLWLAAVFPGLIMAGVFVAYIGIRCHFRPELGPPVPAEERVGLRERLALLPRGIPIIVLIFAVLGLLFLGVTSLLECSAIAAAGALIIAAMNRRLTWKVMLDSMDETLKITSMIMWIVASAFLFGAVFDGLGAIDAAARILAMAGGGRWSTMIIMQLTFILMGMVLDDTAMLLIVAPLYIPIVADMGFSLVWWGVLYVVNCEIAVMTPPFGFSLFLMKGLVPPEITMGDIYRSATPFIFLKVACLALIMVFPAIALWLPNLVFGR